MKAKTKSEHMGIPAGSEVEVKIQKEMTSVVQSGAMEVSISNELLEFEQEPEVPAEPETEPDDVHTTDAAEPGDVHTTDAAEQEPEPTEPTEPDEVTTSNPIESEPDSEVDSEDEDL